MRIVGFSKTSLLDWDGRVAATVYLPGCNFRCPFCHNSDLVLAPESLSELPFSDVLEYVETNREFIDGVVITGGEPTLHMELPDLVRKMKSTGVMVMLDTNRRRPAMIARLLNDGLLDYVAMDLKGPLNPKYSDIVGTEAPLDDVKRSVSIIMDSGVEYEFRTTVVPLLLNLRDIESMAAYIGGARKYALQQFRPRNTIDKNYMVLDACPMETLKNMAEVARQYVRKVVIRGGL